MRARDVSDPKEVDGLREQLLAAGLRVLNEHGAAELTVRRVAETAGSSTMGIYTHFGGRTGMLEALYRRGFDQLRDILATALGEAEAGTPTGRIMVLAHAYREYALANPRLYALLLERPLPDFDPPPALRQEALDRNFTLLVTEIRAAIDLGELRPGPPERIGYLVWTTIHGIVSIELTHALRSPLPGWFLDSPDVGRQVLAEGVSALLSGLRKGS